MGFPEEELPQRVDGAQPLCHVRLLPPERGFNCQCEFGPGEDSVETCDRGSSPDSDLCTPTVRLFAFGTRLGSGRNSSVAAEAWISRACKKMGPAETQVRPLLLRPP